MSKRKTNETDASVATFLQGVEPEKRRQDGLAVSEMMEAVTGLQPKMWGTSIVGFGVHHYQYANGKPAEICNIGFAPRANALVLYLGSFPERAALLETLGKFKTQKNGCIYINKLEDVNQEVLKELFAKSYQHRS